MNLLKELKRRNVIRMAGLYLVGAWLIIQIAETLLPIYDTPGWVLKAMVMLLALGFIPALIFSWVFELTPAGIKRERDVDPQLSTVVHTARKLDIAVIVLLLGVGALMLWGQLSGQRGESASSQVAESADAASSTAAASTEASAVAPITDKSIAVLPFADFSPDGDQSWFADGLTEEVLNALTRTPDLLVSARTSSFKYKGSDLAIPQIAAELGVAHVLEGSVRSSPERIRVTAQLIRAADGFHLWSQTYDRDVADMIQIQEDLATHIAMAMQTSMDPQALADMAKVGTRSVEAYQAYVRGVAKQLQGERTAFVEAYELFERARALDPTFAAAHARAAAYWLAQLDISVVVSSPNDLTVEAMSQRAVETIDAAIENAPSEIDRVSYRALKAKFELRFGETIDLYRTVLAERPSDRLALLHLFEAAARSSNLKVLGETLESTWPLAMEHPEIASWYISRAYKMPDKQAAAEQALQLVERWPNESSVLYQAHRTLLWGGRVEDAARVLDRWQRVRSASGGWYGIPEARQACAEGRRDEVERLLAEIDPADISQRWHLLMLLGKTEEAATLMQPLEQSGNIQALAGFLIYAQFDPTPYPSLMRVLESEKIQRPPAIPIPFACPPTENGA